MTQKISLRFVLCLMIVLLLCPIQLLTQIGKKKKTNTNTTTTNSNKSPSSSPKKTGSTKNSNKSKGGGSSSSSSKGSSNSNSAKSSSTREDRFWESIKDSKNPADFRAYLKKYPNGNYVDLAQNRLDEIEEERKKEEANKSPKTNPIPTTGEPTKKISSRHGMQFTYIPPGEFMMGSSPQEVKVLIEDLKRENPLAFLEEFNNEMPKHKVTFKEGFYMGIYEVTQAQWLELMGDAPSARRDDCPDCPVEQVSWERAIEFIKKMNEKDDGNVYSLPTEAEWEYACRAGTRTLFAFGDSLSSSQANFNGEHPFGTTETGDNLQKTSPVGKYRPNGWGLYDMHGNVFEWCQDIYTGNYEGLPTDGSANLLVGDANVRVMRGGSYNYRGRSLRSADRAFNNVRTQLQHIGFRVVARVKIS